MKLEVTSIDGKKSEIEALDSIFSIKTNKTVVSSVLYKTNANYKGRKAKTNRKMKLKVQHQKFMLKKVLVMLGMQVERPQYLLAVVLHTVQKDKIITKLES